MENSIDGRYGNDHLQGNGGNDILRGEDGRDVLDGGAGDDVLYGSPASDMGLWSDHDKLVGGPGADLFVFVDVPWSGADLDEADVLMDFDRSEGDTVDLAAIDANVLSEGNQPFSFVGGAAFSGAAGELRYYGSGDDTIVQADIDGDAAADLVIVLKGTIALVSSDFLL